LVTQRTTKDRVRNRLGFKNVDSDITDETLDEYIDDASVYIERYTQRITFSTYDDDLVTSAATDLAASMVCRHMAGGKFYGGADYRVGPLTTTKSVGGQQLMQLAQYFFNCAQETLRQLGNSAIFRFSVA